MMRFSRLAWLVFGTWLAVPLTLAAQTPVVFLQFGSYESKAEATSKLKELSTKHAGIISTMPLAVREVAISEDLNVYRTQAGPVPNRAAAQSICAQLASNGDECYIVETAISSVLPGAADPETAAKGKAETPAPAPVKVERDAENMQTLARVSAPASVEPPATEPKAKAPEPVAATPEPAPATLQPAPEPSAAAADISPDVNIPPASGSSNMSAALDQAASTQPSVSAESGTVKIARDKPKPSFWDSINPFSGDEEETPAAQAAMPMPVPPPMPETAVEPVASEPVADLTPTPAAPEVIAEPAPLSQRAEAQPVTPAAAEAPLAAPVQEVAAPVEPPVSSGLVLPPPPIPMDASKRAALEQQIGAQPFTGTVPAYVAPSSNTNVVSMTDTSAPPLPTTNEFTPAPGSSITDAAHQAPQNTASAVQVEEAPSVITAVVPGSGAVQVEEAQRVPISEDEKPKEEEKPVKLPVVAQSAPTNVPVVRSPSNSALNRTLWAHIGQFETPQEALKFWDKYRKHYPDFPVVRVRVTTSYVAQQSGVHQFSLRVGPFSNQKFIDTLCGTHEVRSRYLKCQTVNDMGVSANQHLSSADQPAGYKPARYGRVGTGIEALSGFWVQLGAFPTMELAKKHWEEIRKDYDTVLSSMQAQVSTPPLGSQSRQVYRLRAGPFVSQNAAEETCTRLLEEKATCLVVAENEKE